jgi:hypothetical protein
LRTAVVITAGRRRGQTGYIFGPLTGLNPLQSKAVVFLAADVDVVVPLDRLAPAASAAEQLELALETKKAPPARRPAAQFATRDGR